eukprot:903445-Prymnesium_polylepis.1
MSRRRTLRRARRAQRPHRLSKGRGRVGLFVTSPSLEAATGFGTVSEGNQQRGGIHQPVACARSH